MLLHEGFAFQNSTPVAASIQLNSRKLFSFSRSQMYSSGNPTNIANPIKDVSVQIDIKAAGGRLTLFQTSLCEIYSSKPLDFYKNIDPKHYLNTYNVQDIQLICCQADASTLWLVPPVVKNRYMTSLAQDMNIIFTWIFTRERPKGKEAVKSELAIENLPSPYEVIEVLNGTADSFRLYDAYPRYFRVTSSGEVRRLEQTVCRDSVLLCLILCIYFNR